MGDGRWAVGIGEGFLEVEGLGVLRSAAFQLHSFALVESMQRSPGVSPSMQKTSSYKKRTNRARSFGEESKRLTHAKPLVALAIALKVRLADVPQKADRFSR